jgi:hypothetical protein
MTFLWFHSISQLQKRSRNRTTPHIRTTLPDIIITNENMRKAKSSGHVSHSTSRPAHAVTLIIPLIRRPNTDSSPNVLVTLPNKQLLIRCMVTNPVHTVTIWCYSTRKHYMCVPTFKVTCFPLARTVSSRPVENRNVCTWLDPALTRLTKRAQLFRL